MEKIEVITASPAHQDVILEILEETRAWLVTMGIHQWPVPVTAEWVKKSIERGEFRLANVGTVTVGIFRLLESDPAFWPEDENDAFYLHTLVVRRSWKGKNIGRRLIRWVEEFASGRKRRYLRLDCMEENPFLCRYYERAGFRACGSREIRSNGLLFKCRLFEKRLARK